MQPLTVDTPASAAIACPAPESMLPPTPCTHAIEYVFPSEASATESKSLWSAPGACRDVQLMSLDPGGLVQFVVVFVPSVLVVTASVSSTFNVSGYSFPSPPQTEGKATTKIISRVPSLLIRRMS
jgi:hypothetical protein